MKNSVIITIVVAVVVAGIAFFGGMQYQKSQAGTSRFGQFAQGGSQNGQGFQRNGGVRGGLGGATVGEIVAMDANSITVKLQDGSSKIVNLSGSTTYSKTDSGSKSDLKTGTRVAAFGTSNSDGSITAQNIQLNPAFRTGQGTPPANPNQ
jgi:hypothetical protein